MHLVSQGSVAGGAQNVLLNRSKYCTQQRILDSNRRLIELGKEEAPFAATVDRLEPYNCKTPKQGGCSGFAPNHDMH